MSDSSHEKRKRTVQELKRSLLVHPSIDESPRRPSMRSTGGSNSSNSRSRPSSIQMEPGLQSLLIAEGQAAEMIGNARVKRNELMRQAQRESQLEIERFRRECERRYQLKLSQATQIEQFQRQLEIDHRHSLEEMKKNVHRQRQSLVKFLIEQVIDEIPLEVHPNLKRLMLFSH